MECSDADDRNYRRIDSLKRNQGNIRQWSASRLISFPNKIIESLRRGGGEDAIPWRLELAGVGRAAQCSFACRGRRTCPALRHATLLDVLLNTSR